MDRLGEFRRHGRNLGWIVPDPGGGVGLRLLVPLGTKLFPPADPPAFECGLHLSQRPKLGPQFNISSFPIAAQGRQIMRRHDRK